MQHVEALRRTESVLTVHDSIIEHMDRNKKKVTKKLALTTSTTVKT